MPQLQEYVNRENIQPTDRGTEARVQEGRRVGAFANQQAESLRDFANRTGQQIGSAVRDAGDAAVQYQTHREIGQGVGTFALMQDDITNKWNDTAKNADPNDPSVRQKFIEETLNPTLQKWGETFNTEGGQKFAQTQTRDLLNHMYEKTSADMGSLAAQAVSNNVRTVGNTKSNTAINDPSSVPHLLDSVDTSIGALVDSSPNLKGAAAGRAKTELSEKLKESVVKSGAYGAITKAAPGQEEKVAEEWIRKYPQYINGEEARTLAKAAKAAAKNNDNMDKAAIAYQRQQGNDAVKADVAKNLADNASVDPATGRVTFKPAFFKNTFDLVRKYGEAAPDAAEQAKTYLNWGQLQLRERHENVASDPAIKTDLYTNIFSAGKPTTDVDIYKAEIDGHLNRFDAQNLLNLRKAVEDRPLTGPQWHDTIESVKGLLGTDPNGHEAFGKFVSAFIPEYQRMARAGTLPANALDLRDQNSMISQVMAPYRREPQQMFIDRIGHGLIAPGELGNIPQGVPPVKGAAPPKQVKSIEDAQKLNPGTRYVTPDGKIFVR
jgi:hypothetical protein